MKRRVSVSIWSIISYGPYNMNHMIWAIWYGPYDMVPWKLENNPIWFMNNLTSEICFPMHIMYQCVNILHNWDVFVVGIMNHSQWCPGQQCPWAMALFWPDSLSGRLTDRGYVKYRRFRQFYKYNILYSRLNLMFMSKPDLVFTYREL